MHFNQALLVSGCDILGMKFLICGDKRLSLNMERIGGLM